MAVILVQISTNRIMQLNQYLLNRRAIPPNIQQFQKIEKLWQALALKYRKGERYLVVPVALIDGHDPITANPFLPNREGDEAGGEGG